MWHKQSFARGKFRKFSTFSFRACVTPWKLNSEQWTTHQTAAEGIKKSRDLFIAHTKYMRMEENKFNCCAR